ncbi:MAG: sugar ABC transporter permease, partial [Dactylosporangium sp.]|nr:hypothetical protein [Dactylosporangium sp.]NNJ60978.1 sugar ABC transporter permease [Dactylosporangium sp.]
WRIDRQPALAELGAAAAVRFVYGLTSFALMCALAVMLYLAALRRRDRADLADDGDRSHQPLTALPWRGVAVAGSLASLTLVAVALQAFTCPFVLAGGGPRQTTPVIAMFTVGFQQLTFGPAAAISTLLLAVLAILGILGALVLIGTGARLELDDRCRHAGARRPGDRVGTLATAGAAVLVVAVIGVAAYATGPWLAALVDNSQPPPGSVSLVETFGNTWVPPLISTLLGVGTAAVAGYGIGALRPLGPRSELLLLPFAPFLFVGVAPLALRAYADGATASRLETMLGLVPPTRLAVPALFVFTLLARGQAFADQSARRDGVSRSWTRTYILPTLPMAAILVVGTWLVSAQDLLWPVISGSGDLATGPVRLYDLLGVGGLRGSVPVVLALPWWLLLVIVAAAVVAQLTYLDRIALRVGDGGESGT